MAPPMPPLPLPELPKWIDLSILGLRATINAFRKSGGGGGAGRGRGGDDGDDDDECLRRQGEETARCYKREDEYAHPHFSCTAVRNGRRIAGDCVLETRAGLIQTSQKNGVLKTRRSGEITGGEETKLETDKIALRKRLERDVELSKWADELQRTLPLADAIEAIEARRRGADGDDYRTLTFELINLLKIDCRTTEADRIIDEMIALLPDDVRFPLSKTSLHLYWLNDQEMALKAVDAALVRARRTGFFRREALGTKARILLGLGLGEQLPQILEEIMSLEIKPGVPDVRRERDFVDRAPPGTIPEDVLTRYNAFCPQRDDT